MEQKQKLLAYKQTGNRQSGTTLIFLHGATMTKEGMLPFAERFQGYNSIIFDLTAHGESDGREPSEIAEFAEAVETSVLYLQKEGVITTDLILMGYSMGGAITCEIAIRKKLPLKGIVLLSSGANLDQYTPLVDGLKSVKKEDFHSSDIFGYLFGPDTTKKEQETISEYFLKTSTLDETGYEDLMVANKYNRLADLKEVELPAMIIHGNDDQIILPMSAFDLWNALSGSELLMLPYRGHAAIFDDGEIVAEKVLSFIQKI